MLGKRLGPQQYYGGVERYFTPPPMAAHNGAFEGRGSAQKPDAAFPAPFLHGIRKRLNFVPMLICLFIPWALFVAVFCVLSFSLHYRQPLLCWSVVLLGLLATIVCGLYAWGQHSRALFDGSAVRLSTPSWLVCLFASMVLAWVLAVAAGLENYGVNSHRYYSMADLNAYADISPDRVRGQQVMDAGVIGFAAGTKVEVERSMGFRSVGMYCVAPISLNSNSSVKMDTYDYWAVGMDCCSGYKADFHCANVNNNPRAGRWQHGGGLRLMTDEARPFFRLAVQQAEAMYKIKAAHPLFFNWVQDAPAEVESWKEASQRFFLAGIGSHFLLQVFVVVAAGLYFAKLGYS